MNDVFAVAAMGAVAAICAVVIRKQTPELALLLAICGGALILMWCSGVVATVVDFVDELIELGDLSPGIVAPVIKVTGIAVVTRMGADFCRDAKESALAVAVETAGAAFALLSVIPLMSAVLELVSGLLRKG